MNGLMTAREERLPVVLRALFAEVRRDLRR